MNGDPKTVTEVISLLDQKQLDHSEYDEQYATRIDVRSGALRASLTVYNSAKIVVVGGPVSDLKTFLQDAAETIRSGKPLAKNALPFDIEQFPVVLKERVPDCDPVIVACVSEAIKCFKADALLACAFMIGAASEKAVNLLIQTYTDCITDTTNREKFNSRINGRMISKKFDEFIQSYKSCKSRPTEPHLAQDLEVLIGSMFQFCRQGTTLTVVHDYEGIGAWLEGRWKTKDPIVAAIVSDCRAVISRRKLSVVFRHQQGHRSTFTARNDFARFNSRADALASQAGEDPRESVYSEPIGIPEPAGKVR